MKIVSVEMDGKIYIVGSSDLDFQLFTDGSEFTSFLGKIVNDLENNKEAKMDPFPIVSMIMAGRPKLHDMPEPENMFDVVEEDTEIVVMANKTTEEPFISLISCAGPNAQEWRESGIDLNSPSVSEISNYEHPDLKQKQISKYVNLPAGSIH